MPAHVETVAPVFPVADLAAALDHYAALGFTVERHSDTYGYAVRDGATLHLTLVSGPEPFRSNSVAYLLVSDAVALADEWKQVSGTGEVTDPKPTDYGAIEGSYMDPDGNLLRFGSPAN